eukprot:10133721-Alexandrium_andersonii.AAC.1
MHASHAHVSAPSSTHPHSALVLRPSVACGRGSTSRRPERPDPDSRAAPLSGGSQCPRTHT